MISNIRVNWRSWKDRSFRCILTDIGGNVSSTQHGAHGANVERNFLATKWKQIHDRLMAFRSTGIVRAFVRFYEGKLQSSMAACCQCRHSRCSRALVTFSISRSSTSISLYPRLRFLSAPSNDTPFFNDKHSIRCQEIMMTQFPFTCASVVHVRSGASKLVF